MVPRSWPLLLCAMDDENRVEWINAQCGLMARFKSRLATRSLRWSNALFGSSLRNRIWPTTVRLLFAAELRQQTCPSSLCRGNCPAHPSLI
jgi:hypothetical protein